ncbi:MAG: helix-turn-helix domain-containing protein, partial [Methylococcales bacterium]
QMRRIMGLEVKNDHELLLMLGKMSADEKLATFFLNISSRMKQRNWKELEFNLSMPRQDIANYLGLAVETVSRLMTQFHDKGLIEVDKRNIKINDIDKLKGIVSNCQGGAG